jgi:soluble lytic murein transglycosylase-like protein
MVPERIARWMPMIRPIADNYRVDPLLLAAVVDRESLGGEALTPKGPAGTGDKGHGRGLGQIDDRAHPFTSCTDDTGKYLWKDPWLNLSYSARLLRRLLDTFSGDVAPALAAYNAGAKRVRNAMNALPADAPLADRIRAVDSVTTGKDYAQDVLRRRDSFSVRAA